MTATGVDHVRPARLGRRLAALTGDSAGMTVASIAAGAALGLGLALFDPTVASDPPTHTAHIMVLSAWVTGALLLIYWVLPIWLWQTTPGLSACGLRVITLSGHRPSLFRTLWRKAAALLLPTLAAATCAPLAGSRPGLTLAASLGASLAGFATIALTPRRQALHDLLAGTLVIHRPE